VDRRTLQRLALFVAVSLLTRGYLLGVPLLDVDEAAHLVGSWQLLDGKLLYTDFADNKPPLLYVTYAAAQLLLGRGLLAVLAVVPLTALALSAFFRHDRRGLIAGLLWLVSGAAYLAHDMHSVNCELLMVLPAAAALALLRDETEAADPRRAALAGVLLGVASLLKQPALLWLPAPLLALALARRSLRGLIAPALALLAGGALPWLIAWGAFAARGGAEAFLYWNFVHNAAYAANPIAPAEALQKLGSQLLPFLAASAPLWWGLWRGRSATYAGALPGLLVLCSLPAVLAGFRLFPHYFVQLLPPLALGAAPYWEPRLRRPLPRDARLALAFTGLLLVGFTAANAWLYRPGSTVYEEASPLYARVAQRLHADRCGAGATLFVWGSAPAFYVAAELPPASRFVVPQASLAGYVPGNRGSARDPGLGRELIRPEHWDLLLGDLERNRATYVLDTSPAALHAWNNYPPRDFPRLEAYLKERYEAIAEVGGVVIHRRRGCPGP
jgi:4-amino-4-deoxy-L-arabinose transferase-like glycosyltransferase